MFAYSLFLYSRLASLKEHIVESESAPTFVKPEITPIVSINNHLLQIANTTISSAVRSIAYYKCEITISENTSFINNWAFGADLTSGNGGAIFVSESVIQCSSNNKGSNVLFSKNQAALGGAICSIASSFYISNTTFTENIAYKHGGAVYFENNYWEYGYITKQIQFLCQYVQCEKNLAFEMGGGFFVHYCIDIYFEYCQFLLNKCSFGGGGLVTFNVDYVRIQRTVFSGNIVDADNSEQHTVTKKRKLSGENVEQGFSNSKTPTKFLGRGGGAIFFISDDKKYTSPSGAPTYERRNMDTHHCCFFKDYVGLTGQSFGHGGGNEIMIEGYTDYVSYDDYFYGFTWKPLPSQVVSVVKQGFADDCVLMLLSAMRFGEVPTDICTNIVEDAPNYVAAQDISYANEINTGDSDQTATIPSPSEYILPATPYTRIPRPTDARITFSSAEANIDDVNATFFSATFDKFEIPAPTPNQTAFQTPVPSPTFQPTPVETAAITPIQTPKETTPESTPKVTTPPATPPASRTPPRSPEPSTPPATRNIQNPENGNNQQSNDNDKSGGIKDYIPIIAGVGAGFVLGGIILGVYFGIKKAKAAKASNNENELSDQNSYSEENQYDDESDFDAGAAGTTMDNPLQIQHPSDDIFTPND